MALKRISVDAANRFIALVIGQSGIGKTSLLRTIPDDEPVFVISAESGLLCVRDLVQSEKITGVEVETFADIAEVYAYLQTPEAKSYKWIFIDSLTEIASRCVEAVKKKYPSSSDSFPMWGEYNDKMTQVIKGFRDLRDFNIVFTCLDSTDKDDKNRRITGPDIAGSSLKSRLPSMLDEVFHMISLPDSEGHEKRVFVTQPWERYPAKDRSTKLEMIELPDLGAIKRKILS